MRPLLCHALLASVLSLGSAAGARADDKNLQPFPLPSTGDKALAATPGQRVFRVPMRYAKVEAFYRERFAGNKQLSFVVERKDNAKSLTVISRRSDDTWARAVIREGAVDTSIEVTPVVRFANPETIEGRGLPLVQLVIPPSPGVAEQARSIDHMPVGPGH